MFIKPPFAKHHLGWRPLRAHDIVPVRVEPEASTAIRAAYRPGVLPGVRYTLAPHCVWCSAGVEGIAKHIIPMFFRDIVPVRGRRPGVLTGYHPQRGHRTRKGIPVGCAFDENHIRLGLVFRNEYPAWYFYREK